MQAEQARKVGEDIGRKARDNQRKEEEEKPIKALEEVRADIYATTKKGVALSLEIPNNVKSENAILDKQIINQNHLLKLYETLEEMTKTEGREIEKHQKSKPKSSKNVFMFAIVLGALLVGFAMFR